MKLKKLELTSASSADINLEALYQIMPSAFTEVRDEKTEEIAYKINFNTLRELLGDNAYEGADEEYGFKWVGKNAARREAARPINKTLRPCPEESVDWDNTQNLYIEGDNLEVLKLLQKSYLGKVKMIYIDPPYNTGNDFVYRDDFAMDKDGYNRVAGDVDELGNRFRKNADSNARFHSDWCSMIYERLLISRSLLSDDGVIFISIDDNEVENLKKICNEVLGEHNFISTLAVENNPKGRKNNAFVAESYEYCLLYAKNQSYIYECLSRSGIKKFFRGVTNENDTRKILVDKYGEFKQSKRQVSGIGKSNVWARISNLDRCFTIYYKDGDDEKMELLDEYESSVDEWIISLKGKELLEQGYTRYCCYNNVDMKPAIPLYSKETLRQLFDQHSLFFKEDGTIYEKDRDNTQQITSLLTNKKFGFDLMTESATSKMEKLFGIKGIFTNTKAIDFIKGIISLYPSNNLIIIDFFSGSATTAHAVMQLNAEDGGNRKYIMVQLPEKTEEDSEAYKAGYKNICEIGKERIRRAGKKIKEEAGLEAQNLDTGFRVFKCEDSFMNNVKLSPNDFSQEDLFSHISNIKDGTSDLSLLFGCMLDWGVELSLPLNSFEVDGKKIYNVNDGDLVACFEKDIDENIISAIAELAPLRVVFCDSCFSDAPLKMNLFEIFKQKSGWSEEIVKNRVHVI